MARARAHLIAGHTHAEVRVRSLLGQLAHWGPLTALTIISVTSTAAIFCHTLWWPPLASAVGFADLTIFCAWVFLTLYNFFMACWKGPGFVPLQWHPADKLFEQSLQFCDLCDGFKPPRAHHCRKCDRCVMKRDHHCPWINTCAGHLNHSSFVYFLLFAPIGCLHALCILVPSLYRAFFFFSYYYDNVQDVPMVLLTPVEFLLCTLCVGLAAGVVIAVGFLFYVQFKTALFNETATESWIIAKAEYREREANEAPFVYPYDLGWRRNLHQVFTWSGWPVSNGFDWQLEQLKQKRDKQDKSYRVDVVRAFSGSYCPLSFGCRTCFAQPCTDEMRVAVHVGDVVLVSRARKRWVYGDKQMPADDKKQRRRERGWFPRACVVLPSKKDKNDDGDAATTSGDGGGRDGAPSPRRPKLE